MKKKTWCGAMATSVLCFGAAQAQSYDYKDLTPGTSGVARAINNQGQIVGSSSIAGVGVHATLWSGSTSTDLGSLGPNGSAARAINGNGQVVGYSALASTFLTATAWDTGTGAMRGLTPAIRSNAKSINTLGKMAGYTTAANGSSLATVWSGSSTTYLPTPGRDGYATGINDHGLVIGNAYLAGNDLAHATVWNDSDTRELGTLGGDGSDAEAVNNNGRIAGASQRVDGSWQATLWDGDKITNLGAPGNDGGQAWAINNRDQVVGYTYGDTNINSGTWRATLWDGGRIIDLNNFLDSDSKEAGWVLTQAYGINDYGAIVGEAINFLHPSRHAFLLSVSAVPEPSMYALLLLGLGFMGAIRVRRR